MTPGMQPPGSTSGQAAASGASNEAKQGYQLQRDRITGFAVLGLVFAVSLGISWDSRERSMPWVMPAPGPATTEGLLGFPAAADVLGNFDLARALSPREHLVRIEASGVSPSGGVDLNQPGSFVRYVFQSERGEGPVAPRPHGTLPRRHSCGQHAVEITKQGLGALPDQPQIPCQPPPAPVPRPSCGPKELWQLARTSGATDEQLARVVYRGDAAGPSWTFVIEGTATEGTAIALEVAADCATPVAR